MLFDIALSADSSISMEYYESIRKHQIKSRLRFIYSRFTDSQTYTIDTDTEKKNFLSVSDNSKHDIQK